MTKGERVDRVRNSLHSEEELLRRLPEINAIYDEDTRDSVIRTFLKGCPDYFWERPSSSSGKYHSVDERGKYGNWIHTKRVFAEYSNISFIFSYVNSSCSIGSSCDDTNTLSFALTTRIVRLISPIVLYLFGVEGYKSSESS